jgi:hypothetical protein
MSTAIVLVTDGGYFDKALNTIRDIRGIGDWKGDLVVICVDFIIPEDIRNQYNIIITSFPRINIEPFLEHIREKPLSIPTCDGREWKKQNQWEKLHIFDEYFYKWERVIYFDAGLRILDKISNFLAVDWEGRFVAPDDDQWGWTKRFADQLELSNWPEKLIALENDCPGILDGRYFLNCMWIYDTRIGISKNELIDTIGRYPLWRTNEMGVMNVVIHFKMKKWYALPLYAKNDKILFDWCEYNRGGRWQDYCALKYPVTI